MRGVKELIAKITTRNDTAIIPLTEAKVTKTENSVTLELLRDTSPSIVYTLHGDIRASISDICAALEEQLTTEEILIDEYPDRNYLYIGEKRLQFSGL